MKYKAVLNSRTYDIDCEGSPRITFEEIELAVPSDADPEKFPKYILGPHRWIPLIASHDVEFLIADEDFMLLSDIQSDGSYYQISGCRVMSDRRSIFFRNSIIRYSNDKIDDFVLTNLSQYTSRKGL